ncbi:MAG TPA: D-TA family PLP-dependent enzyme [Puia sp.]|nr:D-TA family PLP-dependent enzyme [Puia sp.]
MEKNWYHINNIDELDSPALVIYPVRVTHNINTAIDMIADVTRLRPHIKTNKSPDATKLMIDAGITKFKCATIAEAEMLGICRAKDALLAYQPIGPKLNRLVNVIKKYPSTAYSCLIDNLDAARSMSAFFSSWGLTVPVYIDVNVGQDRTGIKPGQPAVTLYKDASLLEGIKPLGLHAYDGHIRHRDFDLRKQQCDECFAKVAETRDQIVQQGFAEPVIIAGGSPTFSIHSKRKNCECSPGTFIYWDKGYTDLCPEQHFLPAALVVTRVISVPGKTKICLDLGHKSIAAENEISKRVYFINAPELQAIGQSEEHLVVVAPEDHSHKTGDLFYGMPVHVCPTIALYERAFTVVNNNVNGEWKNIARDRTISI